MRSPRGAKTTEIDWADGHKGVYPARDPARLLPVRGLPGSRGDHQVREADVGHPDRARRHRARGQLRAPARLVRRSQRAASIRTSTCARSASATSAARGSQGRARRAPAFLSFEISRTWAEPSASGTDEARRAAEGKAEREKLVGRAGVVGRGHARVARARLRSRHGDRRALHARGRPMRSSSRSPSRTRCASCSREGAVSSAVVPVLSATPREGRRRRGARASSRARAASRSLALLVVSVLGVVFAGPLTELFAPGYHATPGQFERTVEPDADDVPVHLLHGHGRPRHGRAQREEEVRRRGVRAGAASTWRSSRAAFLLRAPLERARHRSRRWRSRIGVLARRRAPGRRAAAGASRASATRAVRSSTFAIRTCARCSGASCR